MKMKHPQSPAPRQRRQPRQQRGIVMLFGLLALAIMLIGAAAMVRSMNTSMFNAGNLGFKRDMANQVERAVTLVSDQFVSGALASDTTRGNVQTAQNYSPTLLPSNAQGIPDALLATQAGFTAAWTAPDIPVAGQEVFLRYVIDRLCANTGPADVSHCTMASEPLAPGGGSGGGTGAERTTLGGAGAVTQRVVYRLSVRVTGPRNTQAFFQSTMTL
ncbi:MAG: hypothetical protein LH480_04955 [Rubrivivax sp.]|nr:hypothetical protein [Rubrivivax sp.]